jgi:hypothetical protein
MCAGFTSMTCMWTSTPPSVSRQLYPKSGWVQNHSRNTVPNQRVPNHTKEFQIILGTKLCQGVPIQRSTKPFKGQKTMTRSTQLNQGVPNPIPASNGKSSIVEERILRFVFVPSIVEERILRFVFVDSWGKNTTLRLCSFDSWWTNTLLRLHSFDSWGTNTSLRLCSFDSWGTNTSLRLRSFDSWGTNTPLLLLSFDSWGTNKFIILHPFDSWGTNIFVSIQKKSSSFFMLWSRGIDCKESIPLVNVAWARICKRLRSPGIHSKETILLANVAWARICKRLRSPGLNSEESIPPAYVTWRAGTTSRVGVPARKAGNRFRAP